MNKPLDKKDKRADFIRLCINDPKKGAKQLEGMAHSLSACRTSSDVIHALSEIMHLSYRTIERDAMHIVYDTTT